MLQAPTGLLNRVTGLALLALAACGGGSSGGAPSGTAGEFLAGGTFAYPSGIAGSPAGCFVDANEGGESNSLALIEMFWGRLVDVYDFDSASQQKTLRFHNYVIGEGVQTDGTDYLLETDPITAVESLTILHVFGTAAFETALLTAGQDLDPVEKKGLQPSVLPPFSLVARNATLVLRFSDLLDPQTIDSSTLQLMIGYPPDQPFEARILADPNFGGLVAGAPLPEFRPTRVLIDATVSSFEASTTPGSPGINGVGLPPAAITGKPNVALRIPTQLSFSTGQFEILRNTSGHALLASLNSPFDSVSETIDVVRAMRSGGPTAVTGDESNGFMADKSRPRLVGNFPVTVSGVTPDAFGGADDYLANLQFAPVACAMTPEVGDLVEIPGVFAQVREIAPPPVGGVVTAVKVHVLAGNPAVLVAGGPAFFYAPYEPAEDVTKTACFLRFDPAPLNPPALSVAPDAVITVRFSEPMDPVSMRPFGGIDVLRSPFTPLLTSTVVGSVAASDDLTTFVFTPELPLYNASVGSTTDDYRVDVVGAANGATDLAGNTLLDDPVAISIGADAAIPVPQNGSVVLRFSGLPGASFPDEKGPDSNPEIRGQYVWDQTRGVIKGRAVNRVHFPVERKEGTLANLMFPMPLYGVFPPPPAAPQVTFPWLNGVKDPLVRLGSRMMSVWRYIDFGMIFNDEALYNLDVERLYWSPFSGGVSPDFFEDFEMHLAHSVRLPDEIVDGACIPVVAQYSASGLVATSSFDDNVLFDAASPKTAVFPDTTGSGYLLNPVDQEQTPAQTVLMPYPLNDGQDPSKYEYFTWRDTAATAVGGADSGGLEPGILVYGLQGNPTPAAPPYCGGADPLHGLIAAPGDVPTVGLPLLMEFKCFDPTALGLNGLDCSFAVNPLAGIANTPPNFRVYSSGGTGIGSTIVEKNPDLEVAPDGGFNENPMFGTVGAPIPGRDDVFYMGQASFVWRVSRVHTSWFDTTNADPNYSDPVLLPDPSEQPAGTSVVLAFRGGNSATGTSGTNANCLDPYGDIPGAAASCFSSATPLFGTPSSKNQGVAGISPWRATIHEIDNSQVFQVRITFIANTSTLLAPELSALAIAFVKS